MTGGGRDWVVNEDCWWEWLVVVDGGWAWLGVGDGGRNSGRNKENTSVVSKPKLDRGVCIL